VASGRSKKKGAGCTATTTERMANRTPAPAAMVMKIGSMSPTRRCSLLDVFGRIREILSDSPGDREETRYTRKIISG
jgi:hypothetical protein